MDSIAKTSLLTAAMRAVESKRTDAEGRLFSDPYAERLSGDEGAALLEAAIAASGEQPAVAIRTAYIDVRLLAAVQSGVRQIVMLAAGMDTRAYRLSFPAGTTLFELDRPEVLAYKEQQLADVKLQCTRKSLAVDLRNDWTSELVQTGFRAGERSLWIVEGLLMYLEEEAAASVIQRINTLAIPGDIMLFDILNRTLLEAPYMQRQLQFLASMGAPWRFGTNEPQAWMAARGWTANLTQASEVAPTRWPFPSVPLSIPNVPRGFYVEATKL